MQEKCRYIIHAVGPVYPGNDRDEKMLYNAYYNSLMLSKELVLKSIAFPAISTGIYGYPLEKVVDAVIKAIRDFIDSGNNMEIRLVLYSSYDYGVYKRAFRKSFV